MYIPTCCQNHFVCVNPSTIHHQLENIDSTGTKAADRQTPTSECCSWSLHQPLPSLWRLQNGFGRRSEFTYVSYIACWWETDWQICWQTKVFLPFENWIFLYAEDQRPTVGNTMMTGHFRHTRKPVGKKFWYAGFRSVFHHVDFMNWNLLWNRQ